MSEAEALSIRATGRFSTGPNSLGGKWFAETLKEEGDRFNLPRADDWILTMARQRRKRAKVGDVLELEAESRFAYLHYIGKHSEYGDAVLVNPRFRERRQASVMADFFSGAYIAFYPVTVAVSQGLVDVVAHLPPPKLPTRLRRAGARSGRRVDTWIIEDSSGEVVKAKLSDEELQLPIAAIWNHEMLVYRIAEGWTPMQEGRGP